MTSTGAKGGNAPSWLFSFVDLAFLLLIAMTQLASEAVDAPRLGEMVVPRIDQEAAVGLPGRVSQLWQLRIHPPGDEAPFELLALEGGTPVDRQRAELEALRGRLTELKQAGDRKPLLAPHMDSRSQDLLDAVAMLETLWPGTRRATIAPRMAGL